MFVRLLVRSSTLEGTLILLFLLSVGILILRVLECERKGFDWSLIVYPMWILHWKETAVDGRKFDVDR